MTHVVSVVLCTYNGERFIAEQLQSILNQTHPVDEIIIVDDQSKDNTILIIKELLDKNIAKYELHVNDVNLGVVKNFEKGMNLSHGEIIFTSDQDDVWRNDKVEMMLKLFEQNSKCLLAFSNATLVNERRVPFSYSLWDVCRMNPEIFDERRYYDILLKKRVVTGATMALRRELFEFTRPFPLNSWLHDGWLAINAPLYGDILVSREKLIEYRQHGGNVLGASKLNFFEKAKRYSIQLREIEPMEVLTLKEYSDFFEFSKKNIESGNETRQVLDCISFWNDNVKMKHVNRIEGFKLIVKSIFTQGYQRFYAGGLRGVIVDFAYVVVFGGK